MAVKRIALQAPVLAQAAPAKAAAVKNQALAAEKAAAPREFSAPASPFAYGTAVEVRSRIARVLTGRWLVIYVRAEVVSAASGADSSYVDVRYPAYGGVPSLVARVPSADVRVARRARATLAAAAAARPASKRPAPAESSESTPDGACKKAKRTGKGIPMDALRRYMEEVKAQYLDAELPLTRKQPWALWTSRF